MSSGPKSGPSVVSALVMTPGPGVRWDDGKETNIYLIESACRYSQPTRRNR